MKSSTRSNIDISEVIQAGKFVNQSRNKKGKAPLFDYHVLAVDFTAKKDKQRGAKELNQTTKRMHLRRGHIRRLADKTVWVNSCVVGGSKKDFVNKDYSVQKPIKLNHVV